MNFYENIIIFDQGLDDKTTEDAIEKVKDIIIRKGGEVIKLENWGRKRLAYEVNKRKEGFFILFLFKSPPSAIAELERFYKVFDPVIKFLIIRLTKKEIKAIPMPKPASPPMEGSNV